MSAPAAEPVVVDPGSPLGQALQRAEEAFDRRDAISMDSVFETAAGLADGKRWRVIAYNHVIMLMRLNALPMASQRCTEYLTTQTGPQRVELLLLRADIHITRGRHGEALADTSAVRRASNDTPGGLTTEQRACLLRVEGLAAANQFDFSASEPLLDQARELLKSVGNGKGVARIDGDIEGITAWRGEKPHRPDVTSSGPPQTVADRLMLAARRKNELRYQDALDIVRPILKEDDLDPALRPHVLFECVRLLRLTRQIRAAEQLLPQLQEAVEADSDPILAEALSRLTMGRVAAVPKSPRFDQQVEHAHRLVAEQRLDDAGRLLLNLRAMAITDVDFATWHLVCGELEHARLASADPAVRRQADLSKAAEHLEAALDRTESTAMAEIRVRALQLSGDTHYELGNSDRAMARWHDASKLEISIADCQRGDIQVGMLAHSLTNHDLWIRAAAARLDRPDSPETAAVVVAMEAARGATILGQLLHKREGVKVDRNLPRPGDLDGARRWVGDIVRALPRDQAIWLTHVLDNAVHHVLIGHELLHHVRVSIDIDALTQAIENHEGCWSNPEVLEISIHHGEFDQTLVEIATLIHLDEVLRPFPPHITRVAIVPAGDLAKLPFAAMRVAKTREPLVHRFALSNLMCLSALKPFHRKSLEQRGERTLLVHAHPSKPPRTVAFWRRKTLRGNKATAAKVAATLAHHRHRLVRFYGHGGHDETEFQNSWLKLADGQITPDELQHMDLKRCATLVLGACESGMAQRRGRGEETGFVSAGMLAGSSSVIAATWIAKAPIAKAVLDRFERYARFLPRDIALQRAQLDVRAGKPGIPTQVPFYAHPARWACWSLYGDAGYQTRAGKTRRLFRSTCHAWSNRVQSR